MAPSELLIMYVDFSIIGNCPRNSRSSFIRFGALYFTARLSATEEAAGGTFHGRPQVRVRRPAILSKPVRRISFKPSRAQSGATEPSRLRNFALRKIVEKEIDRSNAAIPGDDKIGSRVSWWFAGSARYPSNPSAIA